MKKKARAAAAHDRQIGAGSTGGWCHGHRRSGKRPTDRLHGSWHDRATANRSSGVEVTIDTLRADRLSLHYEANALLAAAALADLRQTTRLPKRVEEALRAIGYIQ